MQDLLTSRSTNLVLRINGKTARTNQQQIKPHGSLTFHFS